MQIIPINLLSPMLLELVGVLIKQDVREICSLSSDTLLPIFFRGSWFEHFKSIMGSLSATHKNIKKK